MREYREFNPKTIMVAIDLFGASYGAINYAKQLARDFCAKILLLHIVPLTDVVTGNLAQLMDAAEEELQKHASALSYDDIRCATIVRAGDIRTTVQNLIIERDVDLLIIGTRGRQSESIAESLLRSAPCPVLTVGLHAHANAYENTHVRRVLFPTDFSEISNAAFAYAQSLVKHLGGEMLVLHADESQGRDDALQLQHLKNEISDSMITPEYIVQVGRPSDVVASVSTERHVDFIVMGVHGAPGSSQKSRRGTASEVIRQAQCPVFTLVSEFNQTLTEADEFRLQQQRVAISTQRVSRNVKDS